jgi:hypothetical protein
LARKHRIVALEEAQAKERERERDDRLDPAAPSSLQLPTKIVSVRRSEFELRADLEDEYFGGFDKKESDHDDGLVWRDEPFRNRKGRTPTWGRVWGRVDVDRGRFARQVAPKRWAHEPVWGLVDGQMPATYEWLKDRGHWPKWRKIPLQRAVGNQVNFPFAHQAVKQVEQKRPAVTPEQDRAKELDRLARRLELLAAPTDPNNRPSRSFACGVFHEEKISFLAQHAERAIQTAWCRRYRPSRELEAKRFPKLKRIELRMLPPEGPGKAERREAMRAELSALELPAITPCPSEWTSAELNAILKKYETRKQRGRKPLGAVAMTAAQRKQRQRDKLRIVTDAPPISGETTNGARIDQRAVNRVNPARLDQGRGEDAESESA